MGLMLGIYDKPGGKLLYDATSDVHGVKATTGPHGFRALTAEADLSFAAAVRQFRTFAVPHVALTSNSQVVWEGRLEEPALIDMGLRLAALGYFQAFSDVPYTALWSTTSVAAWEPVSSTQVSTCAPEKYEIDTNNRLSIAAKKNETFTAATGHGGLAFMVPSTSLKTPLTFTYTYAFQAPATWNFQIVAYAAGFAAPNLQASAPGNGALQTGTVTIPISSGYPIIALILTPNATGTFTGETGSLFIRLTDIRVKTTTSTVVYADEIVRDVVAQVRGVNPSQLDASTALILSPGLDLPTACYEDQAPADILRELAAQGNTLKQRYEVGVWERQRLHFRPEGSAGRQWYVDVASLELERTLAALANSAYAVYQDATDRTLRSAAATDAASVARWGLTRQQAVPADTTSATQAQAVRDTALAAGANPLPRISIPMTAVYTPTGAQVPLWRVRSGDTVTIRNLAPNLSPEIDRLRRFLVAETTLDVDAGTLDVVPASPLPRASVLLAAAVKQAYREPPRFGRATRLRT